MCEYFRTEMIIKSNLNAKKQLLNDEIDYYNNKKSIRMSNLLFFWCIMSIFPQIVGESQNTTIKLCLFSIFIFLIFMEIVRNKYKVDIIQISLGIYFLIIQLITHFFIIGSNTSMRLITDIFISSIYYLIFIGMFSKCKLSLNSIIKFCRLYQIFIIYTCIYNIIINKDIIFSILHTANAYSYNASSFFDTRNTFSAFLFLGIVCTILKIKVINKKVDYIMLIFIIFNLLLTLSRSGIFASIIFFVFCYLFENYTVLNKKVLKLLFSISIFTGIFYITNMYKYIIEIIIRPQSGFTNRGERWQIIWEIYKHGSLLFGSGWQVLDYVSPHNSYLTILAVGGMAFLIFYIVLYFKLILIIKRIKHNDKIIGNIFLSAFIAYFFIISMFEAIIPFRSTSLSVIFTIFLFVIPRYYFNSLIESNNK